MSWLGMNRPFGSRFFTDRFGAAEDALRRADQPIGSVAHLLEPPQDLIRPILQPVGWVPPVGWIQPLRPVRAGGTVPTPANRLRPGRPRGVGWPVLPRVSAELIVGEVIGGVGGFLRLVGGLFCLVGGFRGAFGSLAGMLGQFAGAFGPSASLLCPLAGLLGQVASVLGQLASLVGLLLGTGLGVAGTGVNGGAGIGCAVNPVVAEVVGGVVLVLHHLPSHAVRLTGLSHALAGGDLPRFVRSHDRFFPGEAARVCSPW